MKISILRILTFCIFLAICSMWLMHFLNKSNISADSLYTDTQEKNVQTAYFAGGCFWCMEGIFESQEGVYEAISWYIWGSWETATYKQVSTGTTKHREWVKIRYNSKMISYEKLVELYWTQINPTDPEGQFADKGYQYTTAIYYGNESEKEIAENSKQELENSGKFEKSIVTKILPIQEFYEAEEYHQDYYKKSSTRYKLYKKWSWREDFIQENWKEGLQEWNKKDTSKASLTPLQYEVTQKWGTERAFDNEYWDNKEPWIYVDVVDGTPLYSSLDKYDSGTGWPSFTKAIDDSVLSEHTDSKFFMTRTEIKSKSSDAHLGHVFDDGPAETWGQRFCINSASLRFIPLEDLEKEWYEEYKKQFETEKK